MYQTDFYTHQKERDGPVQFEKDIPAAADPFKEVDDFLSTFDRSTSSAAADDKGGKKRYGIEDRDDEGGARKRARVDDDDD